MDRHTWSSIVLRYLQVAGCGGRYDPCGWALQGTIPSEHLQTGKLSEFGAKES
jgi:hypothetical protein